MSFYDEDRVTWAHVNYARMLDRRQAILLIDYMKSMLAGEGDWHLLPHPQTTPAPSTVTVRE